MDHHEGVHDPRLAVKLITDKYGSTPFEGLNHAVSLTAIGYEWRCKTSLDPDFGWLPWSEVSTGESLPRRPS